jgi:hypothetical protein
MRCAAAGAHRPRSICLLAPVTCASLIRVERLPAASRQTAFELGFVSGMRQHPADRPWLKPDGYDWGMLGYTVGFGGSMIGSAPSESRNRAGPPKWRPAWRC